MEKSDNFWLDNPGILIHPDRLIEFWPSSDMTEDEKLNAMSRFAIYYGVIAALYKKSLVPLYITIGILLLAVFLHQNEPMRENMAEVPTDLVLNADPDGPCRVPTKNNPFMNPDIAEFDTQQKYSSSCNPFDKTVKTQMEAQFEQGLFFNTGDLYGKGNSQRQFFTVPVTSVPNDQGTFAEWCYSKPSNCKNDPSVCTGSEVSGV